MVRGDAFSRAGKQSQERGAIVAGEIEAVIELAAARARSSRARRRLFPLTTKTLSTPGSPGASSSTRRGNDEGDGGLRKFFPQRGDRRRGEDQVADPLELNEKISSNSCS